MADLDSIEHLVLADPGDLPGKTVQDLLAVLATLNECGVSLLVPSLGIDTVTGMTAVLDLIQAYRRAKKSEAIRAGLARARHKGRRIGRPPIPSHIRSRLMAALAQGVGIRAAARRYSVAPASVVAIRREMVGDADRLAA